MKVINKNLFLNIYIINDKEKKVHWPWTRLLVVIGTDTRQNDHFCEWANWEQLLSLNGLADQPFTNNHAE